MTFCASVCWLVNFNLMRQNTSGECLDVRETGTLFCLSHETSNILKQELEGDRWRALMNAVMNFWVPLNAGIS